MDKMENEKVTQLPINRIRTMMKTSPSIGQIGPDALFLVCRAAEMFIAHITKNAFKKGTRSLDYKDLAVYVESDETLEFLVQILPKKITVKEYKAMMANKKETSDDSSSSEEEEEAEEEESGDDEDGSGSDASGSGSGSSSSEEEEADDAANNDVISIDSSSSDEKENSKNMGNKKSPQKHKTGDSP